MNASPSSASLARLPVEPRIYPRAEHVISRSNISPAALKVLYRLSSAGFKAYLVGGCVRDLLLGREPKDFDVATDARPEQVRELFRNCRLVGRRFRLAHVHFGREIVEVATFRAGHSAQAEGERVIEGGRILRDNLYGDIDEDAWRRDFTVNALYYNIEDFTVVDFVGGMQDIRSGQLRLIGEPLARYREDPVRMLRAVRFAAKLGFRIHPQTEQPLFELGPTLEEIPAARLFEEVLKLFLGGSAVQSFELLRHYGLFRHLFPEVEDALAEEDSGYPQMLLVRVLENTDRRLAEGKPVTPAFVGAGLLWPALRRRAFQHAANGHAPAQAMQLAQGEVLSRQVARVAIPRRHTQVMREIWSLQGPLEARRPRAVLRLLAHPRFRAGYDFLLLRAQSGEVPDEVGQWWTAFQEAAAKERAAMIALLPKVGRRRRRARRRD